MKQLYIAFILGLSSLVITSCDEAVNTAVASEVTYLPTLTMNGDAEIDLGCNPSGGYTDAGLTALEQGKEIPVNTVVTGVYFGGTSVSGPDIYRIAYSAFNKDGIPGAAERKVVWQECPGDLVNSIAGMYSATVVRNGMVSPQYTDLGPIIIKDLGGGVFQLSDAVGGYYDLGRGFGTDYAAKGMKVKANNIAANDFTHTDTVKVGLFAEPNNLTMSSFSVDASTKTISFTTEWDKGFEFVVTLTQL